MNFVKQRYGVAIENSWNKYHKKFNYYNTTYRKYLQRKPLSKWLHNYESRMESLKEYKDISKFANKTYNHWKHKYDVLNSQGVSVKKLGYGKSNGFIMEHIISNHHFTFNDENQVALTWFYKKGLENTTGKKFKVVSYLHTDNVSNHLHLLYEPFKHSKVHQNNYINLSNYKWYINSKQLDSYKRELNELYIDNDYDNLIARYSSLPKIVHFLNTRKQINHLNTFLKSQKLYKNLKQNLGLIIDKEKDILDYLHHSFEKEKENDR